MSSNPTAAKKPATKKPVKGPQAKKAEEAIDIIKHIKVDPSDRKKLINYMSKQTLGECIYLLVAVLKCYDYIVLTLTNQNLAKNKVISPEVKKWSQCDALNKTNAIEFIRTVNKHPDNNLKSYAISKIGNYHGDLKALITKAGIKIVV